MFGVCSEAKGEQVIDENDYIGKGVNCVVSLLHHYLENYTSTNQHLLLHANNATGQNKNYIVIQYLAWRVLTGRNPTIKISFMIAGHTKFAPDRFFGLIKKKYRYTSVSILLDLEQVVKSSSVGGCNIAQPTVNCCTGERYVVWYSWDKHLSRLFSSLPGILKFHHFRFEKSSPGISFLKEYAHSGESTYALMADDRNLCTELPATITPPGMPLERKRYLYDKIRQFCLTETAAELTCPKPAQVTVQQATQATG